LVLRADNRVGACSGSSADHRVPLDHREQAVERGAIEQPGASDHGMNAPGVGDAAPPVDAPRAITTLDSAQCSPTTRALQLLFQTVAEVDTLDELARVGTIAVELYEGDAAVLRELMQAIEARATAIREQLRLFPAPPAEVQADVDLEPAPHVLVRESCVQVRTMGPDELNAMEELTHKHRERASLSDLRWAIQQRRRQLGRERRTVRDRRWPRAHGHRQFHCAVDVADDRVPRLRAD